MVEIAGRSVPMTGVGRRIVLVDNYDSFTYNLYQYLLMLGAEVEVVRNDEITVDAIAAMDPDGIVISPGPSRPEHAGISVELITRLGPTVPTLGVCLGHQAMGLVVRRRRHPRRAGPRQAVGGVALGAGCLRRAPLTRSTRVATTRWPSRGRRCPTVLEVTAWAADGLVMGVRHREYPVEGIQFHPESILTDDGAQMLSNWLASVPVRAGTPA